MMAGESFEFKLLSFVPRDIDVQQIAMIEKVENKNHDSLSVVSFENGVLHATAGGEATFKLSVCSFITNSFKVVVERLANQIITDTSLYISSPECNIAYSVLPLDAGDKEVEFVTSSDIAVVNDYGHVTFSQYGTANIVVRLKNNNQISRTIIIKYSNEVSFISFKNVPDSIFAGDSMQLGIDYCHIAHKISQLPTQSQTAGLRQLILLENSLPEVRWAKLLFVLMLLRTQKFIVKLQSELKSSLVILNSNLMRLMMSAELADIVCLEMVLLKQKMDNFNLEAHIK